MCAHAHLHVCICSKNDLNSRKAQQRSANMAAIRSKDTKPEMIVRRSLWKRGFRYRLSHKRLPGHPVLVLRKYRTKRLVLEAWNKFGFDN